MNKLEISQEQGFPVRKRTFDFMQQSYCEAIKNLAKIYGNNYILWGCDVVNGYRTDGAIVIDGEVYTFKQSPVSERFRIFDSVENALYKNGMALPAYHTRTAVSDNTGGYYFCHFRKAIPDLPLDTEWEYVAYAPSYKEVPGHNKMRARIYNGKGQIIGSYYNPLLNAPDDQYKLVCKLPFAPVANRFILVSLVNEYSGDWLVRSALAEVDTNGYIKYFYDSMSGGQIIAKAGWISAEIDLV